MEFSLPDTPLMVYFVGGQGYTNHQVLTFADMKSRSKLANEMLRNEGHAQIFCSGLQFVPQYTIYSRERKFSRALVGLVLIQIDKKGVRDTGVEVKWIPFHYSPDVSNSSIYHPAHNPQHGSVSEGAINIWRLGLVGRMFWINYALTARQRYPPHFH